MMMRYNRIINPKLPLPFFRLTSLKI